MIRVVNKKYLDNDACTSIDGFLLENKACVLFKQNKNVCINIDLDLYNLSLSDDDIDVFINKNCSMKVRNIVKEVNLTNFEPD